MGSIETEVAELKDLFIRRLLDDKAKNKLIDELVVSLKNRDELEKGFVFTDLIKEILVAMDRLFEEEVSPELVTSVSDELFEILRRRGVERISTEADFDPRFHEIIATVTTSSQFKNNEIVDVQRDGFTLNGRIVRPARVVVAIGRDE